jgi:opacity protein-like surface antigen
VKYFGFLLCVTLLPSLANAQTQRARDWDAGFHIADYSSLSLTGFRGASMEVESSLGYGLSGAYNISNHVAVGADLSWRSPDYRATFVPDQPGPTQVLNATMDVARIYFKGIYYFLESNLTPFVEIGYGWTQIDSNILDRPPITGCWWDPWWGYICQTSFSTYTETKSTYGVAIGVRWDTRSNIALRGGIGSINVDRAKGVDNSNVETLQLEVLWRF